MYKTICFPLVVLLFGCATAPNEYESIHQYQTNEPLSSDGQISVQTPKNARFDETVYEDSGYKTAAAFKEALESHAKAIKVIDTCELNNCLKQAKSNGSKYLMALNLIFWEDRATNWSGKADRLTVKVSTYEVSSGDLLYMSYLHTNTSIYAPSGGHVEDYLPFISNQYVSTLYK